MNLGDGLLFELENGKPRLILLTHAAVVKNPVKLPSKHRAAHILSARQPSCVEEVRPEERPPQQAARSRREARCKAGAAALSCSSGITATDGRSTVLTSSKAQSRHKESGDKAVAKVKTNKHKLGTAVGPPGSSRRTGPPPDAEDGGGGLKPVLSGVDAGLKDGGVVCLTSEQLQKILSSIQTSSSCGQRGPEEQTAQGGQTDANSASSVNEEEEREIKEDEKGEEMKEEGGADGKYGRLPQSSFSWLEEHRSGSRAAIDAKKAQWKRELDEQVALKQQLQHSTPPQRLQGEEYAESVSSVGHRQQHAAIRSSLRLGEVTPMEEALSVERKEEQRRIWLEELDRQREEAAERRKREKLLRRQTEDHERWAAHFDSLQRRAPVQPPAPGQLGGSERGDWDPSSSLSLVWEAASSCGAESVIGASVDSARGLPSRSSYLRTMTSLLDPTQIEERERRKLKQLEQQRAIEAQIEERKKQREQEEATRRREEEEEEKRVALEREKLQEQYELEMLKKKEKNDPVPQAEQPENNLGDGRSAETSESGTGCVENGSSSSSLYKHTSVQTEDDPPGPPAADRLQSPDVSVQNHPPPPGSAEPPHSRSRTARAGKENICLPAGEDPYQPFARTEKSRKTKRRPEWNTQRPSRRFVPASERYPVALQRDRQESRLRRQAELLALQERTRLSRTEPPPHRQEAGLCPDGQQVRASAVKKVESGVKGHNMAVTADRGRSPPISAITPQQASSSPPPALEFIPYLRTAEVFSLDPQEPADTPPPRTHAGSPPETSASPPVSSHRDPLLHPEMLRNSQRQQEILRGLAQLRQSLLQKQKELETDLNPVQNRVLFTAHRT